MTGPIMNVSRLSAARQMMTRPYQLSVPTLCLMLGMIFLLPLYLIIAAELEGKSLIHPELFLDDFFPLTPAWTFVYGSHMIFYMLPLLLIRQDGYLRQTFYAYISVWLFSYSVFLLYPTVAPRPESLNGGDFFSWLLQLVYHMDPPRNCFPSLHVAHSFVTALSCSRLNLQIGNASLAWAFLIALSTMYTKQHYAADVIAGAILAFAAYWLFLSKATVQPFDNVEKRGAPLFFIGLIALHCMVALLMGGIYLLK